MAPRAIVWVTVRSLRVIQISVGSIANAGRENILRVENSSTPEGMIPRRIRNKCVRFEYRGASILDQLKDRRAEKRDTSARPEILATSYGNVLRHEKPHRETTVIDNPVSTVNINASTHVIIPNMAAIDMEGTSVATMSGVVTAQCTCTSHSMDCSDVGTTREARKHSHRMAIITAYTRTVVIYI